MIILIQDLGWVMYVLNAFELVATKISVSTSGTVSAHGYSIAHIYLPCSDQLLIGYTLIKVGLIGVICSG